MNSDSIHKSLLEKFKANDNGSSLEYYIKKTAWEEDSNHITKIYLVKDCETNDIVFFFGLKTGILYDLEVNRQNIFNENEIYVTCIDMLKTGKHKSVDDALEEVLSWFEDIDINKENLRNIIEQDYKNKLKVSEDKDRTKEGDNVIRARKTYSGIELSHVCKNKNYKCPIEISFPLGFFVFWEIIVPKVLDICSQIGCEYLYLFAADNTPEKNLTEPVNYSSEFYQDIESNAKRDIVMIAGWYFEEITSVKENHFINYKVNNSFPKVKQDYTQIQFKELSDKEIQVTWIIEIEVPTPIFKSFLTNAGANMAAKSYGSILKVAKKELEK